MIRRSFLSSLFTLVASPILATPHQKNMGFSVAASRNTAEDIDVVKQYFTMTKSSDFEKSVDMYLTQDVVYQGTGREAIIGKDYIKQRLADFRQGFGFYSPEMIAEHTTYSFNEGGDILVSHIHDKKQIGDFRGIEATGLVLKNISSHYVFSLNDEGLIDGYIKIMDYPSMARQMGLITEDLIW